MTRSRWILAALAPLALLGAACDETVRCGSDADCSAGLECRDGVCTQPDPCEHLVCDAGEHCIGGACVPATCGAPSDCTHPTGSPACYDLPGACRGGLCVYTPVTGRNCDDGDLCTTADACDAAGVCAGVPRACATPPPAECADADHLRVYAAPGQCQAGECSYPSAEVPCPEGCLDGVCQGCQADCAGRECGGDSCGGSCGECIAPESCDAQGQCGCTPDCGARECGMDPVCGTLSCGTCDAGCVCNGATGMCDCGCVPECAGRQCGPDGCGGSCGDCPPGQSCDASGQCQPGCSCGPAEACVLGRCAPVALLYGSEASASGVCPPGYQEAGRWRTGPFAADAAAEGFDLHGLGVDAGFMWLCSADPARVRAIAGVNDCGGATSSCAGDIRGHWHVGAGCSGTAAIDADGVALSAGWLRLCVAPGVPAFVEAAGHDCGAAGPGCGGTRWAGAWHTSPAQCGAGDTGVGDSGAAIQTGWMELCVGGAGFPPVSPDGLAGKALAGYQGWFAAPGDGSAWNSWIHWFRSQDPSAANATFDLWPDLREYEPDELFPTAMTYPSGAAVGLFSAHTEKTVSRHFRWMAENGLDGVLLQRFLHEAVMEVPGAFRDQVTRNVRAAAEAHGRVFAIEYDISGSNDDMLPQALIDDWKHMVDDLGVTASSAYLRHQGRPLVGVWGIGFNDRAGLPEDITALMDFFHNAPEERYRATVMGGVPEGWRTGTGSSKPGYDAAYRAYDVINPWLVGRYGDEASVATFDRDFIEPDLAECADLGKDYMPVIFPGFSWANLTNDAGTYNLIPRMGGRFYWRQFQEFLGSGCQMAFLAMFDEVDEGTAILKAAPTQGDVPVQGRFLALDADGEILPADWYLKLAGGGTKTLQGIRALSANLPPR